MNFFGIFLVYGIIWPLSLYVAQYNSTFLANKNRLFDLFHSILPETKIAKGFRHIFSYTCTFGTLFYGMYNNEKWLNDYVNYMLFLQGLRCLSFNITLLPDSSQVAHLKPYWQRYFFGGQGDLIPSGHILYGYAPLWFLYVRNKISPIGFGLGCFGTLLSALQILMTRSHYSIDILVALSYSHWVNDWMK